MVDGPAQAGVDAFIAAVALNADLYVQDFDAWRYAADARLGVCFGGDDSGGGGAVFLLAIYGINRVIAVDHF